ncbi:NAD(P)-dependent oxidoreductase [Ferruginibacter paludis]|uniref:NAD-dependent epimerase/dehydratase family protein n=1 Tax=Ferruginibacter paludis TaxID=1310417 RepID=UPI0025B3211C|nr:NAD(P)-dependent oxidoreductase [Ferruginibacter paludis]MDN3657163.1 NAD(P)-dependent oxidoreductase [Ferruginibacter paludis]
MKKILVTGATGFIGNYVVEQLLQQKDLTVIASSADIKKARLAPWFSSVIYIPFNLKDYNSTINYYDFFYKPDSMIHLAWEGLPNYTAAFHVHDNLPRHYSFLKNCIDNGLTDITITGTCFEYGMQEGVLSENMDTRPANSYAIAKDTLRKQMEELQLQKIFHFKWIRLFYMYGTGQSPNSLISQLDKALDAHEAVFNMSGGEQERDYLPVEKVASYIVKIALQCRVTGLINCCSGRPVKVRTLVENYLKQRQKQIQLNLGYYPYADYEPMRFWGDNQKLKTITDNDKSN